MSEQVFEIVIHGRHAGVSERFKEFAIGKLGHVDRFAVPIHRIDVEVSHEANPRQHDRAFEVELTCSGSPFVRVEAHAADKYAALEAACDKLEERLRRLHERRRSVRHERPAPDLRGALPQDEAPAEAPGGDGVLLESGPLIVRSKHIETVSMTVEQAVEAMELVGHDFFLFHDKESDRPSVVYRRHAYNYGLIRLA